jgi:hypothetical protein
MMMMMMMMLMRVLIMVMMLSGLMMMTLMTSTSICIVDALPCRHPTPVSVITSQIFHSSPSLSMLKKPEDYYQAFGESSSKSYSFPTQGNLDPPSQPLKRFPLRETKDARKPSHTKPRPDIYKIRNQRPRPLKSTGGLILAIWVVSGEPILTGHAKDNIGKYRNNKRDCITTI